MVFSSVALETALFGKKREQGPSAPDYTEISLKDLCCSQCKLPQICTTEIWPKSIVAHSKRIPQLKKQDKTLSELKVFEQPTVV